jgi:hypothetical protein
MSQKTSQITREQAKTQVIKTRNFYINSIIYILVNLLLLGIDILPDGLWDWSFWVIFGWGLGLMFEAISIYGPTSQLYQKWEEEKIDEVMKKR